MLTIRECLNRKKMLAADCLWQSAASLPHKGALGYRVRPSYMRLKVGRVM